MQARSKEPAADIRVPTDHAASLSLIHTRYVNHLFHQSSVQQTRQRKQAADRSFRSSYRGLSQGFFKTLRSAVI